MASGNEKTVTMGGEAALPVRPLPEPPKALHLLGPGLVLTALGVGLGETFMWPRLVIVFGPSIRWLFLLGVTIQLVVMMEMARWAMATGESIFFGAARIHRGLLWFFWLTALLVYIWPGHVSLGAQAISTITGINWVPLAVGGILLIGIIITFSKVVYNMVESVLSTLISVVVIGASLIAAFVGTGAEWWSTIAGLFHIGWWNPQLATAKWLPIVIGSIAFAGPSGMQQMWYTLYLRDKGAGMGKYAGRITSWLTGEPEAMPETGSTFDANDPEEMQKWKGWTSWNKFDAWVLFWGITMVTTVIFTVLAMAAGRLDPAATKAIAGGKQAEALKAMATAFSQVGGKATYILFYLFMGIVGWKMSFGIFDAFARGQADMTWYFMPGAKKYPMNWWYYFFLYLAVGVGVLTVLLGSPKGPTFILNVLAFLSAFVMGAYCPLLLYVNNRFLPKPVRLGIVNNVALVVGTLFYLGGLFYSVIFLGAIPKG